MIMQTDTQNKVAIHPNNEVKTYTFIKEDRRWYIDLPEYLEQGWSKADLEMMEGASKLLNTIAQGKNHVSLRMSTQPFKGADVLELMELCEAPRGGGIYLMELCHGRDVSTFIWICDIALFVFGDLPEQIYVQSVPNKTSSKERSGDPI